MALTRPSAAQLSSAGIDFTDPLIRINKDQTGVNDKDLGIIFERGSDTNVGLIWDESSDKFAFINTVETGTTNGNVSISSYSSLIVGSLTSNGINFPLSDGSVGQVLSTDGNGNLSFISASGSPGGANTQVQINNNGSFAGSANLTFNGTTLTSTAFSGPLTGNVTGNASTASAWETSRTITLGGDLTGNVSIDGSSNVTLTAAIAPNSVALGTDTTGNYVASGSTSGNGLSGSVNSAGGTFTVTSNATSANTANTIVFRDASGNFSAGVITATTTQARYADLAENYLSDYEYTVGTVLQIGGTAEVTIAIEKNYGIVGTVSDKPGYLMNSELEGNYVIPVAYIGRVPCRVKGIVKRGDLLAVSDTPGVAIAKDPKEIFSGQLVGKALQDYNSSNEGLIEILVGRL